MSLNKGGQKSSSQSQSFYDPNVLNMQVGRARAVDNFAANSPYQGYSGAPLNLSTNYSAPQASATPLTAMNLSGYMNPYTSSVVDASLNDINHQAQIADQQAKSEATMGGAFGGDGASVLRALTGQDYARQAATTSATLRQQGFQGAQGAAQQDIGNQLAAAFANQNAGLQGAQLNAGNAQANYGAAYQQYLNAQQYPLLLQQLQNQTYGLLPTSPLQTSTSTGKGSNFGFSIANDAQNALAGKL